jgi:hypothetical protein
MSTRGFTLGRTFSFTIVLWLLSKEATVANLSPGL